MNPDPNWIVLLQSLGWDAVAKTAVAALLGAIVGLERVWGDHEAGLLAAQIVTGVGFLVAGALIQARGHVRGLTTAASIWLVVFDIIKGTHLAVF